MASIARVRAEWGGSGLDGPGVSTFYTANLSPATYVTAVRAFFNNIVSVFPTDIDITVRGDGELIDDATGALSGSWSMTPPAVVTGTNTADYARGVGTRIKWLTGGVTGNRRVRGSTFIVPMTVDSYNTSGALDSAVLSMLQSAATALAAADSGSMVIWTRPSGDPPSGGASHAVTGSTVPNSVSWLRSRRT